MKLLCVFSPVMAFVVGCASEAPAAATDADPLAADGGGEMPAEALRPAEPLAPGAWEELGFDARKLFMREVIMPTMRPLFVAANSERFMDFSCSSCHGQAAAEHKFAMPNSELPALAGPPPATMDSEDAQWEHLTEFMRNTVKPKMAELLGEPELRCSNCHPSAS